VEKPEGLPSSLTPHPYMSVSAQPWGDHEKTGGPGETPLSDHINWGRGPPVPKEGSLNGGGSSGAYGGY